MKSAYVYPAILFCALPLAARPLAAQTTGTSHPEQLDDTITYPAPQAAKPSPAVPMDPSAYPNGEVQSYQPAPAVQSAVPSDDHYVKPRHHDYEDDAPAATPQFAHRDTEAPQAYATQPYSTTTRGRDKFTVTDDPTSGVVMDVPTRANELAASTLLRTHLTTTLSTRTTRPGDLFTATLAQNITRHGQVLIPRGSTLHGRVTAAHSGHGVGTAAVMRLEATSLTLPDGSTYPLLAEVVDLSGASGVHVTSEGVIKDNALTKGRAAELGGTTGGGAITGALVGGGVGAAVGAVVGASVGTVLYLRRDREQTLPAHTELVFSLNTSLDLTPHTESASY